MSNLLFFFHSQILCQIIKTKKKIATFFFFTAAAAFVLRSFLLSSNDRARTIEKLAMPYYQFCFNFFFCTLINTSSNFLLLFFIFSPLIYFFWMYLIDYKLCRVVVVVFFISLSFSLYSSCTFNYNKKLKCKM